MTGEAGAKNKEGNMEPEVKGISFPKLERTSGRSLS